MNIICTQLSELNSTLVANEKASMFPLLLTSQMKGPKVTIIFCCVFKSAPNCECRLYGKLQIDFLWCCWQVNAVHVHFMINNISSPFPAAELWLWSLLLNFLYLTVSYKRFLYTKLVRKTEWASAFEFLVWGRKLNEWHSLSIMMSVHVGTHCTSNHPWDGESLFNFHGSSLIMKGVFSCPLGRWGKGVS